MVRWWLQERHKARVSCRTAALLLACAFAALSAGPALAVPGHDAQGELLSANLLADAGPARHLGQEQFAPAGAYSGGLVGGNSGTFDVAAPAILAAHSANLPPGRVSAAMAERVLVTNDAPPAAETAYVQGGAIVLASVAKSPLAIIQAATDTTTFQFKGSTAGCFGAGCTPTASANTGGLSFTGGTFNLSASGTGSFAIGGAAQNLGTVSLSGASFNYTGTPFSLIVNFTSPGVTSGTFAVNLHGSVSAEGRGGVQFTLTNPTQSFTLPNGTFTLRINNVEISGSFPGSSFSGFISADLQVPPTPDVPRDEVVLSLEATTPPAHKDINTVLDLSQLTPSDVSAPIDSGVTSGADPSEWDLIDVDEGNSHSCKDGSGAGAGANAPANCHTEKK